MKNSIKTIVLVFILLLSSCKPNIIATGIKRDWSFDSITYDNEDMMYYMGINMFTFKNDNEIVLPYVLSDSPILPPSHITYGEWTIIEKKKNIFFVKIISENKAFNDLYNLTFHKEVTSGKLLAILISKKMKITMRCALNPIGNEKFIDELVSLTE